MKRGEVWTVAGGPDYAGKPRPAVIVQSDYFEVLESVTICAFTTEATEAPLFRIPVEASHENGLRLSARLMADKITTVPKTKIGFRVGELTAEDMERLERAMARFLGIQRSFF